MRASGHAVTAFAHERVEHHCREQIRMPSGDGVVL